MVGLGVEQAHAQLGADQMAVGVDEGLALIGVELAGQAAVYGFFERVMERLALACG